MKLEQVSVGSWFTVNRWGNQSVFQRLVGKIELVEGVTAAPVKQILTLRMPAVYLPSNEEVTLYSLSFVKVLSNPDPRFC